MPLNRMPERVRWFLCDVPLPVRLLVLSPALYVLPIILAAVVAYFHGYSPCCWQGWDHLLNR